MNEQIQELRYQVGEAWKGTYNALTVYGNANVVQDAAGLSVYRSLKPGNVGHPLTDTAWWFKIIDMSSIANLRDQMQQDDATATEHEAARVEAEAGRVSAEQSRVNAESARVSAEQGRVSAESQRVQNEQTRQNQEAARVLAESQRVAAESSRVTAEEGRVSAEQARVSAETQRQLNEENRVAAEQARVEQYASDHAQAVSDHDQYVLDNAQLTDLVNRADADHTQAESDHTRAGEDHTTAGTDHTTAGTDHTRAGEDHTQAGTDHETAGTDHTRAGEDHTTAAADHTQAGEDHQQYVADHASIASKANVAADPTAGNLAALDAGGNPTDSGIPADNVAQQNGYYKEMRTGLADNIVDERPFTEMGMLHMTASSVEVAGSPAAITYPSKDIADGQSQVLQLQGNGAAFMQLYPCGTSGDFSADSDCPNDLPVRYSNQAGTTELGYLDLSEVLLVSDLVASDCALLSAILTADAARGCTTGWLDEAGNELAVSVSEGSATWTLAATSAAATPTKVVRRAIRVKASEANRGSESWWFTTGSTLRQIRDMAVKEGIDSNDARTVFYLAKPFDTCSLADWIHYQEAKEGTVGIETQNAGTLEGAKLFQLKAVTSSNLLDPETGVAELAWYKDEGEGVDGRYTVIGLPAGATLSLESKVTGLTTTPAVDAAGHLLVGGHALLHITSATGLAGCSVIATYDGSLDQEPADEYAAQVLSIDVTKVYGKLNGEGEYVQVAAEGLRRVKSLSDSVDMVNATATMKVGSKDLGNDCSWTVESSSDKRYRTTDIQVPFKQGYWNNNLICALFATQVGASYDKTMSGFNGQKLIVCDKSISDTTTLTNALKGVKCFYELKSSDYLTYSNLIYRQSGQPDIPLNQLTRSLQVCNWATTKAVCAAATETTVGSTTSAKPNSASPVVKSEYSSNIPEQVDSLDARVTALEQAIANMSNT